MPRLVWSAAGEEYEGHEPGRTDCAPDTEAIRAALLDVLAKGPRSQGSAQDLVCAKLRAEQPRLKKADVELVQEELADEGVIEAWEGPRGARLVGMPGSQGESPEAKAVRLAKENPSMSATELRDLAGCRKETACEALRLSRNTTPKDRS